jgi:mannose-6-phosphate isomerase-like protein (cupin superfamily)
MARHDFDPTTIRSDGRPPAKARLFDGTLSGPHRGSVNGEILATQITVLAYGNDEAGLGPKLHVHPYDEVFVIQQGRTEVRRNDGTVELLKACDQTVLDAGEAVIVTTPTAGGFGSG